MAIRNIVKIGDEILRKTCRPVTQFDDKLHALLDDMYETMVDANGVGLAAPQVGILRRVFIIWTEETGLIECINPEILETLGKQTGEEGCLSVVGRSGIVERPAVVKFRAFDRNGNLFEKSVNKLAARAICHEYDHLDGTLFVDKMTEEIAND